MKTQLYILICISCICIGCGKKEKEYGVETRPENFPDILVPIEGAIETRYSSPETGNSEGTYAINFWLGEKYPAPNTIEQIQKYLKNQGCFRVEGSVLFDLSTVHLIKGEGSIEKDIDITDEINRELEKAPIIAETQWQKPYPKSNAAKIQQSYWVEEWITKDDGLVRIVLSYYLPGKGYEGNRLWVHILLLAPSSWMYPYVQEYKENHPEEFQDSNEIEIKSPGD